MTRLPRRAPLALFFIGLIGLAGLAPLPAARVAGAQTAAWTSGTQDNVASYRLEATLDPLAKQVVGSGRVTYRNPSPDTLSELWLHLYLNAFRSTDTRWMREAGAVHRGVAFDPAQPGWIHLDALALAGGEPLTPLDGADDTIVRVPLPRPLGPGQAVELDVRWTAQLPKVFARTGFSGNFFMVGQWYPKLAVYDRGRWFDEPWHANAEFFADFGSYDLALTVPAEYVTGASGLRTGEVANPDGTRTVRYRAERVTDLAWTAWPELRSVEREIEAAGERIQLELLLPPGELPAAERHLAAAQLALDRFGRWYGRYPWPKMTIVVPPIGADDAGGMEYPTLVTTGRALDLPGDLERGIRDVELLTVHEIAHQWFPLQVQSNEATEAWLDEGFAEYLTMRALRERYPEDRMLIDLPIGRMGEVTRHRATFLATAAGEPLAQPSWGLTLTEYAGLAYSKGGLALLSLERLLGEARFTAAVRAYADQWRWRHPTSADLRAALEAATGERLDWFFNGFVFGDETINVRVTELAGDRAVVEWGGPGGFPLEVRVTFADGATHLERWDGAGGRLELGGDGRPIAEVAVDPEQRVVLDLDRFDNTRLARPDPLGPLTIAQRWLAFVQPLLQLLGQIG